MAITETSGADEGGRIIKEVCARREDARRVAAANNGLRVAGEGWMCKWAENKSSGEASRRINRRGDGRTDRRAGGWQIGGWADG